MARITYVKSAQQRYRMVPVIDPETGQQKITPVTSKRSGEQKTTKRGKPVVQRQTVADKSQPLPMPRCEKCGVTIEVGQPYKHVSPKSGPYGGRTRVRCAACPSWKPSELSSSKMASIMALQEEIGTMMDGCESADDFSSVASEAAEIIRGVAEEYRESAQNIIDGFGHDTSTSDELNEKADSLDSWADDVEQLDFEDFDEEQVLSDEGIEQEEDEDDADFEQRKIEATEDARQTWMDEQRELLEDAVNDCPV